MFAVVAGTLTASAIYKNNAYDFVINGISAKVNGNYSEVIPVGEFVVDVSITNKGGGTSVLVLLASYAENGQMLKVQSQKKSFGKGETSASSFEIENTAGNISTLKAFLLNSENELIPVAKTFALSNLDSVISAYANSDGQLIVQTIGGRELIVSPCLCSESFDSYEVGTRFDIVKPAGEFDAILYVDETPYTVHFSSIYYVLTAKKEVSSVDAWRYKVAGMESSTYFVPYESTVYIEGKTSPELAGKLIHIVLSSEATSYMYDAFVDEDGTISVAHTQGEDGTNVWYGPKDLYFSRVLYSKPFTPMV